MKKGYTKPVIKKVKLVMDEAVLAGCKVTPVSPGKGRKNCSHSGCKTTQAAS